MGGVFLNNIWRKKQERVNLKIDVLRNFYGYKFQFNTGGGIELEKTINEIPIAFCDSENVLEAYKKYYKSVSNEDRKSVANDRYIKLLKAMCDDLAININKNLKDEDLLKVFQFPGFPPARE